MIWRKREQERERRGDGGEGPGFTINYLGTSSWAEAKMWRRECEKGERRAEEEEVKMRKEGRSDKK